MAKRKAKPVDETPKETPEEKAARQEALETTWVLKGQLKSHRMAFLRIAGMLVKMRDRKLYEAMNHKDIESYADEHLSLARASLYSYLKAYDWVKANHPAWLEPHPKDFIPDLSDITALARIEKDLAQKGLDSDKRDALEALRKKALDGKLSSSEVKDYRRRSRQRTDPHQAYLKDLCAFRRRGSRLSNLPPGFLDCLDKAIGLMRNYKVDQTVSLRIMTRLLEA
jgi:hypothetical protein